MADLFCGVVNKDLANQGQVKQDVLALYDLHLGSYSGSKLRNITINQNPITKEPQVITVLCPADAPVSVADTFFEAFKAIVGLINVYGMPQPLQIPVSPQHVWLDPIPAIGQLPVVVNGYQSNPANFPSNAPDNDATSFAAGFVSIIELNPFWADLVARGSLNNLAAMDALSNLAASWVSFDAYQPPVWKPFSLSGPGIPKALVNLANDEASGLDPSGYGSNPHIWQNGLAGIWAPITSNTEYWASTAVGEQQEAVYHSSGASVPGGVNMKNPPSARIKIADKKLRIKIDNHWYVAEVTQNSLTLTGTENLYENGQVSLGSNSKHPGIFVILYDDFSPNPNPVVFMPTRLVIRQGNENAGPLLNDNGIEDPNGNPSTLVTMIPSVPIVRTAYTSLADKYKFAL